MLEVVTPDAQFLKAYEVFIMLKTTSQEDETSDLKNADLMRVQGFSGHLMHSALSI